MYHVPFETLRARTLISTPGPTPPGPQQLFTTWEILSTTQLHVALL